MARRNPAGGIGIGTILLLLGGGIVAAKIFAGGDKKKAGTGWSINGLCTNIDLVDVGLARADAIRFGGAWGSPPASKTEAEDRLRLYFSNRFSECTPASPPETFWDINGNTYYWAGVVQYAWERSNPPGMGDGQPTLGEGPGAQIPQIVGMIVGGPVVA
jgi:hypothetical protein